MCLVTEYAEQGDLASKIEGARRNGSLISESEVWQAMYHLAQGLDIRLGLHCLNRKSILHRDLKSANVFVASSNGESRYKLGDFNVSKLMENSPIIKKI